MRLPTRTRTRSCSRASSALSETTRPVLVRRGLGGPGGRAALPRRAEAHDPFAFAGMEEAVELVLAPRRSAAAAIAVHGDYDVDGVCSTAVLVRALRDLGAEVRPRLPSRTDDGYGLSRRTVEELRARGAGLLVTADCGIGAVEEVARARALGMDVVVTDHHRPGRRAAGLPGRAPGASCGYPCEELCATGVAYKLARRCSRRAGRDPAELERELDLVALATVADLVPLRGENRTLVRRGLRALAGARRPGLRALHARRAASIRRASTEQHARLRARAADQRRGPPLPRRRRARADADRRRASVRSRSRASSTRSTPSASRSRPRSCSRPSGSSPTRRERRGDPAATCSPARAGIPGVIGIVASRLVERYHRPFVLIALDGDGRGRGSARSILRYDLHAGLARARRAPASASAATGWRPGWRSRPSAVDRSGRALVAHATRALDPEDLVPVERVDAIVPGDALGLDAGRGAQALRPFGMGNPAVTCSCRPPGSPTCGRWGGRAPRASRGVRRRARPRGRVRRRRRRSGRLATAAPRLTARLEVNEWAGAVEPRLVTSAPCRPRRGRLRQDAFAARARRR